MEFFNKLKSKLRTKNIISGILFFVFSLVFIWLAFENGFSSDTKWQIGPRGVKSGIPLPNWLISCLFLLMAGIFILSFYLHLKSLIKNTEFNKLLMAVQKIGDPDTIGETLSSMSKSPYIKSGDLRYNPQLLFYLKGTDATIISAGSILRIQTEIERSNNSETNFLCVYHNDGILKIAVNKKKILPLLEDMRKTLA